ncbi:MAG: 4-(cytidine 5'-diphospho)-2-C-methyl-D-erythritol kinase [Oscillospiraceae bacterium]
MELIIEANAKLNLTLDIQRRRGDGYHDMRMVMQSIRLHDTVTLKTDTGQPMKVHTNLGYLPCDSRNIAARAAMLFSEETGIDFGGLLIDIEKQIPVCAGMGGGSADAAAVLRGLNKLYGAGIKKERMIELGLRLGADVPFCLIGGTALAEGVGERLSPLRPLPDCHIVICKPRFSLSTPVLFGKIDPLAIRHRPDTFGVISAIEEGNIKEAARRMYNVFEPLVLENHREISEYKNILIQHGALGASMSGTGPSVFGLFEHEKDALAAAETLRGHEKSVFITGASEAYSWS